MNLRAELGIAPIAWSNDDLPQLGGDTPLSTYLSESAQAGFRGVETGGKFPKTAAELKPQLGHYGLQLASGWYSGTVLDGGLEAEQDKALAQLSLFRECGAACLVYGETAGTIQNRQEIALNRRRTLSDEQMRSYGKRLTRFAEFCAEQGVPLAFHHHMGTAVESEHDIDRLMNATGEAVRLLYDTGHLTFAGADLLRVLRNHGKRVVHVHAKDVRKAVHSALDWNRDSFLDAVLKGVYTVPGDGFIDFGAVVQALAAIGYQGWFIVEAEQDPALAPPLEYARIGYRALSSALHAAGYHIEGRPS